MSPKSHRNALQPGHLVLWYQVDRILGQGGFGITYLAHDTNLNQPVAVKEYLPMELAVREDDASVHPVSEDHSGLFKWGLERFITEAQTLAQFDHPNIVRVLSVFEANNTAYMVMRYEHGKSMQELLPRWGTMEEGRLLHIVIPILGGLQYIHERGFIHRDIKPGNIFVREDGSPVLIDFGSSRQALGQATRTLTSLVSPGYAPFEQYHSKSNKQGPWSDIYGMGATLYRAISGSQPMDAVDRSEGLLKQSTDPYVTAREAAKDQYSDRFLDAIDHALCFNEEERPQTVEEWLGDFGPVNFDELDRAAAQIKAAAGSASDHGLASPEFELATKQADIETVIREQGAQTPGDATPDETVQADTADNTAATIPAANDDETEWRIFIGEQNTDTYLRQFRHFAQQDKRLPRSWHWPAALFTLPWMMYRRLYLWALLLYPLITIALSIVLFIPLSILAILGGGDIPEPLAFTTLLLVSVIWPGLYAHAIYYRRANRNIGKMRRHFTDNTDAMSWLARKGGTSRIAAGIGILLALLLALISLSALKQQKNDSPDTPPTRQEQISELFQQADEDMSALRLTTPANDNAYARLQEILRLDPGNEQATTGIQDIVEKYGELAFAAAERGEVNKSIRHLERALEIGPDKSAMKHRIVGMYKNLGEKAWESRQPEKALTYLKAAQHFAPDSAELKHYEQKLRKKIDQTR